MLLSYEVLVNQLHSLVKSKSQVKILYTSHGQPLTIRLSRRLITHHRRARRIPRSCPNSRTGNLQPSSLPSSTHTHRKTILKHCWRTRSRTNLNNPTSYRSHPPCSPLTTNPIHNRWNWWTRPDLKSYWPSMILKLWIHRLQRSLIWLVHDPYNRTPTRPLPALRSRPSCCRPHRIPHPHHRHRRRCTSLLSYSHPGSKNRRNPRTTKPNIIYHHPTRNLLRSMLWDLWGQPQLHTNRGRINPPHLLRELIFTTIILIIKKLCTSTSLLS